MPRRFDSHFGKPVDVLGASTGGSLALQLIADRPDVVRKAVVACAAYTLGPVAKQEQLELLRTVEATGRYSTESILDAMSGKIRNPGRSDLAHADRDCGCEARRY